MTREKFKQKIKYQLEHRGYKRISVSLNLFGLCATVTARDINGKKHTFKVKTYKRSGRTFCSYCDLSDTRWIDELEFFDAIFDDK